jgi:integrase
MPRVPGIWLREQTGCYCTKINRVVHKLAKDEESAKKAFYKLMAGEVPAAPVERHSVRWLCDKFLDRTRESKTPETFTIQHGHLKKFTKTFGTRPCDSLKVHEVNEWMDKTGWGNSTKGLFVTIIKAVFNWGVSEDYLTESPLKKLKRRKIARRERVLTEEEEKTLLKNAAGCFRDYVFVLLKTGMRSFSEAAKLTAKMIDWAEGKAEFKEHKNAKKGKDRVVFFAAQVMEVLKRLAVCHPEGLLFRNTRDLAWRRDTIHSRITQLCEEVGLDHFNVYNLHATYITNALIRGVPVEVVAERVGTSAKMIWNHYAMVNKKTDALKDAARRAIGT